MFTPRHVFEFALLAWWLSSLAASWWRSPAAGSPSALARLPCRLLSGQRLGHVISRTAVPMMAPFWFW